MVDSDIEIFGDIWSSLHAIYDVDVTSYMIQNAFDALIDVELSSLQNAIRLHLSRSVFIGPPTVNQIKDLINVKGSKK